MFDLNGASMFLSILTHVPINSLLSCIGTFFTQQRLIPHNKQHRESPTQSCPPPGTKTAKDPA